MRDRFDGMGIWAGAAALFAIGGILAVLLEIQSPSFVLWNGIKVNGYTQQGLTFFRYHGDTYTVDNRFASVSDKRRVPTTVYLSRSDPTDTSRAWIDNNWTRWSDFLFVIAWFFAGAVFLTVGFVRRAARRRRRVEMMGQFGAGISDEVVRRILAERQQRRYVVMDDD